MDPTAPFCLSILLKPRTADVLSIQFVEAKLIIKASDEYPSEPPKLDLKDARGLDDSRHATLLVTLEAQAKEMSGEPMLWLSARSPLQGTAQYRYQSLFSIFHPAGRNRPADGMEVQRKRFWHISLKIRGLGKFHLGFWEVLGLGTRNSIKTIKEMGKHARQHVSHVTDQG
ncbi:hypothetical protein R1sor_014567 [Riccia sorocarpa]|uniref:RWD domain-containing protein n=1 Tax=Riccia sorocarpa TaxID=122646 RepID=A0ABD3HA09_9MARC